MFGHVRMVIPDPAGAGQTILTGIMARAGFRDIRRFRAGCSDEPALVGLDHTGRKPEGLLVLESLIVEGVK